MFRLKNGQESFTVMDGPQAGRTYMKGKVYGEIPKAEAQRFEEIPAAVPAGETKPAKADKQKAAKEPPSEKNEEV